MTHRFRVGWYAPIRTPSPPPRRASSAVRPCNARCASSFRISVLHLMQEHVRGLQGSLRDQERKLAQLQVLHPFVSCDSPPQACCLPPAAPFLEAARVACLSKQTRRQCPRGATSDRLLPFPGWETPTRSKTSTLSPLPPPHTPPSFLFTIWRPPVPGRKRKKGTARRCPLCAKPETSSSRSSRRPKHRPMRAPA